MIDADRKDEGEGLREHHLGPGLQLPPDDDEDTGYDPDVATAYDELARVAKAKTKAKKRRVH